MCAELCSLTSVPAARVDLVNYGITPVYLMSAIAIVRRLFPNVRVIVNLVITFPEYALK